MNPAERRRAGAIVQGRLAELRITTTELAAKAGLDPTTVRAFLRGDRWPHASTRAAINTALGWCEGEIARRALRGSATLDDTSTEDLAREVYERVKRDA
jgi:predicted transcriptional regulator